MIQSRALRQQLIALPLTVLALGVLILFIYVEIGLLNKILIDKISLHIRLQDVLIGMTIYLKTAVDFALFIGRLMQKNQGLKGRIGIELGTAAGNGIGTALILVVWVFFRQFNWLLALMVLVAAVVLLRLAEDGLEHAPQGQPGWFSRLAQGFEKGLRLVNGRLAPLVDHIIPKNSLVVTAKRTFLGLFALSFTVPLILGLDDFAGYVPLFSLVSVFGFAIGAMAGHTLLNIFLFLSPSRTTRVVQNPVVSVLGGLAFVALAIFGFVEAYRLLFLQ